MRNACVFSLCAFAMTIPIAMGQSTSTNWLNWRGPNFDGSLQGVDPPFQWSSDQNIRWKVPVPGSGKSTPIIWEDRIFLLTAIETDKTQDPETSAAENPASDAGAGGRSSGFARMNNPQPTHIHQFCVLAYERQTGKEVWRTVVKQAVPHESGHTTNSYASASPVTDGQHLFVSFGSQGIYCLDLDGKTVWSRDLGRMQTRNAFGEGGSPALHEQTLVVPWDHEGQSAVIALDARTGETRWRTERDEPSTWSTPLIVSDGGRAQVITNGTTVRSYDLKTGKLLWECGGQVTNPIPCPLRVDNSVICMTGYRGNAIFALPLDARGDISDSDKILWQRNDAAPYVSSPALYKGRVYFTKSRDGIMSSVDAASGRVIIPPTRLTGVRDIYASPIAVADRIYFTSREGVTTVVRHADTYEELAVNRLGEAVDASPAISGDQIFIRGAEHLYCIAR